MSTTNTNIPASDKKEKKSGVLKYLDNTFGDDGLRTDVKITVTNETLYKLIATGIVMSILMPTFSFFTKKILENLYAK